MYAPLSVTVFTCGIRKTFPSTTVMRKIIVVTLTETRRNFQFTYIFQAIRNSWPNTAEIKSFPLKTVMGNWFPITHCYK